MSAQFWWELVHVQSCIRGTQNEVCFVGCIGTDSDAWKSRALRNKVKTE
jgi:hypothetical protein